MSAMHLTLLFGPRCVFRTSAYSLIELFGCFYPTELEELFIGLDRSYHLQILCLIPQDAFWTCLLFPLLHESFEIQLGPKHSDLLR